MRFVVMLFVLFLIAASGVGVVSAIDHGEVGASESDTSDSPTCTVGVDDDGDDHREDDEVELLYDPLVFLNDSTVELLEPFVTDPFAGARHQSSDEEDGDHEDREGKKDEEGQNVASRWTVSEHPYYENARLAWATPTYVQGIPYDLGLTVLTPFQPYAVAREFPKGSVCMDSRPLVIQFEVKYQAPIECGSAYLKLLPLNIPLKTFSNESGYALLFGPDRCDHKDGILLILHKFDPKLGRTIEYRMKKPTRLMLNYRTHVYQLAIWPIENRFEISMDLSPRRRGQFPIDFHRIELNDTTDPPKEESCNAKEGDSADSEPTSFLDFGCFGAVAFEGWTKEPDTHFDNIYISHDVEAATRFARATWIPKYNGEFAQDKFKLTWEKPYSDPGPVQQTIIWAFEQHPYVSLLSGLFFFFAVAGFVFSCCLGSVTDEDVMDAVRANREMQRQRDRLFQRPREDFYYPEEIPGTTRVLRSSAGRGSSANGGDDQDDENSDTGGGGGDERTDEGPDGHLKAE